MYQKELSESTTAGYDRMKNLFNRILHCMHSVASDLSSGEGQTNHIRKG